MSFDTDRHKLQHIWEEFQRNSNQIDYATLIQGKKEVQIQLSQQITVQFNKFPVLNSEWIPMQIMGLQTDGSFEYKAAIFQVILTLPKEFIPFARLNLAYRRTDSADIFADTTVVYSQFVQLINASRKNEFGLPIAGTENRRKALWNVGFSVKKNNESTILLDFEVKLFFTLLNPYYITAS